MEGIRMKIPRFAPQLVKIDLSQGRFFLGASLLTKDPAKFERPRTGARVRDMLLGADFKLPFSGQYAGGQEPTMGALCGGK